MNKGFKDKVILVDLCFKGKVLSYQNTKNKLVCFFEATYDMCTNMNFESFIASELLIY